MNSSTELSQEFNNAIQFPDFTSITEQIRTAHFFSKNRVLFPFKKKQTTQSFFFFYRFFNFVSRRPENRSETITRTKRFRQKKEIESESFDTRSKISEKRPSIANKNKAIVESFRPPEIDIANEIEKQTRKKAYNKIAYNKNAVTIFIIANDFVDEKEFLGLKKIDVSTFKAMYQLMSNFKKKVFYKTIMQILTSDTSDFIDQTPDYFLT